MKAEGIIKGWGIGVNTPEPILRVMQEAEPDLCLLASRYYALNKIFPVARQRNVKFVIGSSLNAGFISGSPCYNYGKSAWNIPRKYIEKREKLRGIAAQYGVDLRTAALPVSLPLIPCLTAPMAKHPRSAPPILARSSAPSK
jgi:D-threo-aldose 1-dehydrogenase